MASAFDSDSHVDAGEAMAAEEEDGFVGLEAQDLRFNELDWAAIDLDQASATLAVCHSDCRLLPA